MRILFAPSARMLALALFATALTCANAQSPKSETSAQDALYQTVAALDAKLFDAVNNCDMETVDSMWVDDAEFYHNKNGLMVGRENIVNAIKNNLCEGDSAARAGDAGGVSAERVRGGGDRGASFLPSQRQRKRRRGEVHSRLAEQGWSVEDHASAQLRPRGGEVS
jgi:hypothetical protein